MIRTKGEPGTGDVVQAVRHMRKIQKQIRDVVALRDDELFEAAKQLQVPVELVARGPCHGQAPRRKLCRRRSRDPRRRRADDAAGRRGRLCWLGHL